MARPGQSDDCLTQRIKAPQLLRGFLHSAVIPAEIPRFAAECCTLDRYIQNTDITGLNTGIIRRRSAESTLAGPSGRLSA